MFEVTGYLDDVLKDEHLDPESLLDTPIRLCIHGEWKDVGYVTEVIPEKGVFIGEVMDAYIDIIRSTTPASFEFRYVEPTQPDLRRLTI